MLETALLHAGASLSLAAAVWAVVRLVRASSGRGRGPEAVFLAALFALLGFLVARGVRTGSFPATNLGESLALFSFAVGVCYLVLAGRGRPYSNGRSLGAFVLPAGAALAVASAITISALDPHPRTFNAVFLALHATSSFAAYAAFTFGSCAGIAYLIQERALRRKSLGELSRRLPSLSVLDRLGYRAVALGFPLLTFGMVTGSVWASRAWGSYWFWEPKLTLSLLLWLLCAAIFHLRTIEKYQGRRTALLTVASALMVLVVFLGAGLISGGRHVFL
jgi:cytochrome c-type biogenesis protein CcsB